MTPLTDEENESYENQNLCHICKKRFTINNKKVIVIATLLENIEGLLMISAI